MFHKAKQLSMFVIIDNVGQVFLTNNQLFSTSYYNVVYNFTLVGVNYIAVKFENTEGPGGFLMSLSNGGCITNSSNWRCTNTNNMAWNSFSVFHDYYQWPPAVTYTANNGSIYTSNGQFPEDCPWISIANSFYVGHVLCILPSC